jgi:hypothetical protein
VIVWYPGMTIEEVERDVILAALKFHNGNKTRTADSLGIASRTLDNKLARYRGDAVPAPEQDAPVTTPAPAKAPDSRKHR